MSMDEARVTFSQEAEELLQQMEDALISMEQAEDNSEHLNSVFRSIHTIKGAAGVFGFDAVVEFTHPVETELDRVRSGERQIDESLIAALLSCKDHTAALVQSVMDGEESGITSELKEQGEQLLSEVTGRLAETTCEADNHSPLANQPTSVAAKASDGKTVSLQDGDNWLITLHFKPDALRNGLDPLSFLRYLKTLGTIADIVTLVSEMTSAEQMDAESCYMDFFIVFNSDATKPMIEEVFEFAEDDCDIRILPPSTKSADYLKMLDDLPNEENQRLGELLINIGALTPHELKLGLAEQQQLQHPQQHQQGKTPIGEILVNQQVVDKKVVEKALQKQASNRAKTNKESQVIRVSSAKLGQLINLVGELVISNAAMKTMIDAYNLGDVGEIASTMDSLVEEIRDNALQLRMVEIGDTFSRFRRIVRDVSRELQKEIDLTLSGNESELDKAVVEKIADPLTHLVRNSLDHGIEGPEEREAKGKPRRGTIGLHARHESGHIVIEISDDGAGLDPQKIRAKAEAIGLIKPEQVLTHRETLMLIMEPGLTTKQDVSDLSGRGVGMDVVRRNIESLRGSIELDSELGKGTTITIYLPLTLAIIDGFVVGARNEVYIIPLSMVEECIEMDSGEWQSTDKHQYLNLRGDVMPFIHLGEFFGAPPPAADISRESLVIVRFGTNRAGLVIDHLYGEQQTVIKPVGKVFSHLKGISGATVLGSGEVALILDIPGLVGLAINHQANKHFGVLH